MGVYIKSMKMPDNCDNCDFMEVKGKYGEPYCELGVFIECPTRRPPDCPLVPVPPHGKLIDADALLQDYERIVDSWGLAHIVSAQAVRTAPTIIPASKEE